MASNNEWSPLKKVIIGNAQHAKIPMLDISVRTVNYSHVIDERDIPYEQPYPAPVVKEATQDLEILSTELKKLGITVYRPLNHPTPYYNYCPRDLISVIGDKNIIAPMSLNLRKEEYKNLLPFLSGHNILAPNSDKSKNYNLESVGNKDILALNEYSPKFDAANIIRANDDILYLISNSGNAMGARWLQEKLGSQKKVRILKGVYSYMHIDSTVAFLREGLMLVNPSRINDHKTQLPEPFNKWDCIYCPEPIDIGHYPGFCNASAWINMNLLSINENLVVIEERQVPLAKELEKYNIESLLLPMRQQRTLGGGFHCVTLDIEREGA